VIFQFDRRMKAETIPAGRSVMETAAQADTIPFDRHPSIEGIEPRICPIFRVAGFGYIRH
jgi:hypothetical protein